LVVMEMIVPRARWSLVALRSSHFVFVHLSSAACALRALVAAHNPECKLIDTFEVPNWRRRKMLLRKMLIRARASVN